MEGLRITNVSLDYHISHKLSNILDFIQEIKSKWAMFVCGYMLFLHPMSVVGLQSRRDLFADKSCFMLVLWFLNQNVENKKGLWMICYSVFWENIIMEQSWCVQNQPFLVWMISQCISCHFSRSRSYSFSFHLFIISLCNAVVKKWQKYIPVTNSKMYFTFGLSVMALTCI